MLFDKEEIKQRLGSDFTDGQAEKVAELMAAVYAELKAAQERTMQEVEKLQKAHNATTRRVRQFPAMVGDCLEETLYETVRADLESRYGIIVEERLTRGYLADDRGKAVEVAVFGWATRNGQKVMIIGESKRQFSKDEVDLFIWRKLNRLWGVFPIIFPVLIAQEFIKPDLAGYIRDKGIAYYCPPAPPEEEDEADEIDGGYESE